MLLRRKPKLSTILVVLGGMCALSLALWGALQLPLARARIQSELRAAIRRELGLNASMSAASVSLPLTVVGEDIELVHPQHGLLVRAKRIEVSPSLMALSRGKFRLKRILIDGPHVRLRVQDGQIVNLPKITREPDTSPENRKLPLKELVVRGASVQVDALPEYSASLERVHIALGITRGTLLDLSVHAGAGEIVREDHREVIDKLMVSGRVAPDKVQIDALALDSAVLKLRVSRAFLGLPWKEGAYAGRVQVEVDLGRLKYLPLGVSLPALTGKLALAGHLKGKQAAYRFDGKLHADNPTLAGFGFGILDLNLALTPDEVQLLKGSQGRIVQDGGIVKLSGKIGLSGSMPLEVNANIERLDFHKLMAQLDVTQDCVVNWVMRGGFKLKGTAVPVDVTGPIWTDTLYFRALTAAFHDPSAREVIGTPPGRVTGRVAVRPDALRFENLHGRLPHSDLSVLVHVGFVDKISVIAKSHKLDLRDATGLMGMPLAGQGSFSLEVGGTYDDTTLTGTLDLKDFALDHFQLGHIRTRAVLEKDGVAVRFVNSDIRKNDSHYVVDDLFLDFSKAFELTAKARFERLALADFYHSLALDKDPDYAPYQGHLKGSAQAHYTRGFPGETDDGTLRISAALDVLDARLFGIDFNGGRLEADWEWLHIKQGTRGARLALNDLRLRRGNGALIGRGTMELGGGLRLTLFAERLSLAELGPLRGSGLELAGELGFAGKVRGTLWVPEGQLDLNLSGVRVNKRGLGDGSLKLYATHRDDPWLVRAAQSDADPTTADEPCVNARRAVREAQWKGASSAPGIATTPPRALLLCGTAFGNRVDFDVGVGLDERLPVRGSIDARDIPALWVLPTPRAGAGLLGAVSGHVDLQDGFLSSPDSLVGSIRLSSLRFGQDSAWLESDGPLVVALTGKGAKVERAFFRGQGTRLSLQGKASFRDGLALQLDGRFDLAVLPSIWPAIVQASGLMEGQVKLSGNPEDPSVFGQAKIENGSLLSKYYHQPLDKISAQLRFSEHDILLDHLRGTLAGGALSAHGSAAIAGQSIEHYEIFASAREVAVEPISGVELAFSSDTKLVGGATLRVPELTGTVRLLRAVYKRPFSLGLAERLTGIGSQAQRVERETYDPRMDNIAFDLRILDETPIKVTNNLLTAEFVIEDSERPFRIVGTDQRTGVLGTLALTRGTMVFRNAQFLMETGTVTFFDETRIRPRLDVRARTEFRRTADTSGARWLISLHVHGDTENLKLDTFSDPALAREDIALLLTVGFTRAEAERLQTQALTKGAALEALASVTGVDREVKKALPLIDDFAFTTAYSTRTNRTEPQVVVGKRLSDRVRATATTGLSAESNFKAGVQWRLNNQTSVEAGYDNIQTTTSSRFGNIGLDLRWRLEFD